MKNKASKIITLAVSGLIAGGAFASNAFAGDHVDAEAAAEHADKATCKGKETCKAKEAVEGAHDKAKDAAHDAKEAVAEGHDKASCKGKEGCKAKE